jgi:NAD+ dependent glucose-6-phosphate dehydrogenase
MKVVLTGAAGVIGTAVREHLRNRYEFVSITRQPTDFSDVVADISNFDAIRPAFDGADAVVHLAASISVDSPWEAVLTDNLIGTYNVYEAARQAGLKAIVFASSNHTIGGYEVDGAPRIYDLDDPRKYDHNAEIRPDSLYGVSKVYGEALGRYYHETYGMRVYNLRIGSVRADDDPTADGVKQSSFWLDLNDDQKFDRLRATWLSQRDCAELIGCCLEATTVPWATVYGISDNPRQFWDIEHARRLLGYAPKDSAPTHR